MLKKSILTGLIISVIGFILSLITIIISINSMYDTTKIFEVSFSILNNSGFLNSSIEIVKLIIGCCLLILSIIMLGFILKRIHSKNKLLI